MENDEKKKKIIDELKRRKGIVEKHIDFLNNHPKDFYSFIYEALNILKN